MVHSAQKAERGAGRGNLVLEVRDSWWRCGRRVDWLPGSLEVERAGREGCSARSWSASALASHAGFDLTGSVSANFIPAVQGLMGGCRSREAGLCDLSVFRFALAGFSAAVIVTRDLERSRRFQAGCGVLGLFSAGATVRARFWRVGECEQRRQCIGRRSHGRAWSPAREAASSSREEMYRI